MIMNYTKTFYAAFPILIFLFSLALFDVNADAQTPSINKPDEKQKAEEAEIKKFADEFIENLEVSYDFNQVPERFFDVGFKKRLSEISNWDLLSDNKELRNQFNDDERYMNNVSFMNFFNLITILASEKFKNQDKDDDFDSDNFIKQSLPPHIFKLFTKSKWLRLIIENIDSDKIDESMTLTDYRSFIADLNSVSDAMKMEVKKRKLRFSKKLEMTEYFPAEKCKGKKCFGLPENTIIFAIHKQLMCLRIVKINNELKIVNIFNAANED